MAPPPSQDGPVIRELNLSMGFLGCRWNEHIWRLHGSMSCSSKLYFCGVIFLRLERPMSLNPVLKKVQLELEQTQKQSQCPGFRFDGAGGSDMASVWIQSTILFWVPHYHEPCGRMQGSTALRNRARRAGKQQEGGLLCSGVCILHLPEFAGQASLALDSFPGVTDR